MHTCAPDFKVVGKALTGEDACQMASRLYPDLLITDIRMPVMNGLDLLERVRNYCPLTKFIIISGFSDFKYAQKAIRLKVSECLLNPIDPEDLTLALGNIRKQFQIREFSHTCPLKVFLSFLA